MFTLTLPRGYAYEEFAGQRITCNDLRAKVLCWHILITYQTRLAGN